MFYSQRKLKHLCLSKIKANKRSSAKIITIDIETINKGGLLIPILYSMFDGKRSYSFFTSDPKPLLDKLLSRRYRGYSVYAHNLSRFDIIFLFKYIASFKSEY